MYVWYFPEVDVLFVNVTPPWVWGENKYRVYIGEL